MNVNEWFLNNGTHAQGLDILWALNVPMGLVLRLEEETLKNIAELKYELGKYKTDFTINDKILFSNLPYSLRVKTQEKNSLFYECMQLKLKLNDVDENDNEKSLILQREIYMKFKRIDQIWIELDYYREHKVLIEVPEGFDLSKMTIPELYKTRHNLENRKSRRFKTIISKMEKLECETSKPKRFRLEQSIKKKEAELYGIDQLLIEIKELLNE